jgi:hypothetical protein
VPSSLTLLYIIVSLTQIDIICSIWVQAVTTASIIRRREEAKFSTSLVKAEKAAKDRLAAERKAWKDRQSAEHEAQEAFKNAEKLAGKTREKAEKDAEERRKKKVKEIEKEKLRAFKEAEDEKVEEVEERKKKDEANRVTADDPVVVQSTLACLTSFIVRHFVSPIDVTETYCQNGIPLPPLPPPKFEIKLLIALRLLLQ